MLSPVVITRSNGCDVRQRHILLATSFWIEVPVPKSPITANRRSAGSDSARRDVEGVAYPSPAAGIAVVGAAAAMNARAAIAARILWVTRFQDIIRFANLDNLAKLGGSQTSTTLCAG